MCKTKGFDDQASLEIQSWCGELNSRDKPQLRCDISDGEGTTHFIELKNTKTYDRKIQLKGFVRRGRAKFEAEEATVNIGSEWQHDIDALFGSTEERIRAARVCKIAGKSGTEWIEIEVKYDNQWSPKQMKNADTSKLRFQINVL